MSAAVKGCPAWKNSAKATVLSRLLDQIRKESVPPKRIFITPKEMDEVCRDMNVISCGSIQSDGISILGVEIRAMEITNGRD